MRIATSFALVALLATACGGSSKPTSGESSDGAIQLQDSGLGTDAGPFDSGPGTDAGFPDSGPRVDAGGLSGTDGGLPDSGPGTDGGLPDSGSSADAGPSDAGPQADAGADGGLPPGGGVVMLEPAGSADQFTRSIEFGDVALGDVVSYDIVLLNDDSSSATVTASLQTSAPNNFYLKMPAGDGPTVVLAPQTELTLEVRFMPAAAADYTATVTITTTASATPQYTVNVTGNGGKPQIDVCSTDSNGSPICASTSPDYALTVDLGSVVPGQLATKPLTIKDLGSLSLTVSSIAPTANTTTEFSVGPNEGPVQVAAGAAAAYEVIYAPLAGGPESGVIAIQSNDPATPDLLVTVTGTGSAPQLCFSPGPPSSVEFGDVPIGTTASQSLVITSCGSEAATITAFGPIQQAASAFAPPSLPSTPYTMAPGATLTLNLTFTPATLGEQTGSFPVVFTGTQGPVTVTIPLDGTGTGCALSVPPTLAFGDVPTNGSSTQPVRITNSGSASCSLSALTISGAPFTLASPPMLPDPIPVGEVAILNVTFGPTSNTSFSGMLSISSNAVAGTLVKVVLTGTGIAAPPCLLMASPSSVIFSGVSVGVQVSELVTLTNEGTTTCDVVAADVAAVGSGSTAGFTAAFPGQSGTSTIAVTPGGTTTVEVTYRPPSSASQNVTVQVAYYNDSGSSLCSACTILGSCFQPSSGCSVLSVPVSAATLAPKACISPASIDFGAVAAGQTSTKTFIITSCGQGALTVRGLKWEAGSSGAFTLGSTTVPLLLAAGSTQQVNVQYAPTGTNGDFGAVSVLSNDPNTPKALVPLRGNAASVCATQLACSPAQLQFPSMEVGRPAAMSLVCVNVGIQPVTVTGVAFSAQTSAAFTATVGQTPQTVQPGGLLRAEVDYTPQQAGTDTGAITIASNACSGPSIGLAGTGKVAAYPPCLTPQAFSPSTKWNWTGSGAAQPDSNSVGMSPVVVNLTDDNGDGLINVNDIPDVLFTTCSAENCCVNCLNSQDYGAEDFSGIGILRAVHGKDGTPLWDVTDASLQLDAAAQLAAADLDGSNVAQIVAVKHTFTTGSAPSGLDGKYVSGVLLVFDHTGQLLFQTDPWTGDPNNQACDGAPAIADLDGDGFPEIVFERTVFNYDGTKKFDMAASGAWGNGAFPTLEDVNGDGLPEIVSGAYVYEGSTGNLLWMAPNSGASCDVTSLTACATTGGMCDPVSSTCIMPNGPTLVLGMTISGTKKPVVVLRDGPQSAHILDGATGTILAAATWPAPSGGATICPAAMAAADLDGDGEPEIVIPGGDFLYAFKYNGTATLQQMWTYPINDYQGQCGASGAAAFDFEGNGKWDVVYHDTGNVYVFRGADGTLIYEANRSSTTLFETPVVADVDNDGHADILFTNESGGPGTSCDPSVAACQQNGLVALSDIGNNWPATRRVWSDHAYHVSGINGGGEVPRVEIPNWKNANNWRAQNPLCTPSE